jgi:hypothetical protein
MRAASDSRQLQQRDKSAKSLAAAGSRSGLASGALVDEHAPPIACLRDDVR